YILVLYFSVAFLFLLFLVVLVWGFIVLLFCCLRKRKERVISLTKGVKKLRLLTTSTLTKV
ncbi:hypothetical protein ECC23_02390, partial [Helicobacter pylori]